MEAARRGREREDSPALAGRTGVAHGGAREGGEVMRLYDLEYSGNCYKVRLMLHHLGIEYEKVVVEDMTEGERPEALIAENPSGRVPLLVLDDGRTVAESNAILWLLAEDTEYVPSDSFGRTQVLRWMFFEQNHVEPNIAVVRHWRLVGKDDPDHRASIAVRTAAGHGALRAMERHLPGRDFFVDGYSIADIALYAYTHVAPEGGFELDEYPLVRAWIDRVRDRPDHVPMTSS